MLKVLEKKVLKLLKALEQKAVAPYINWCPDFPTIIQHWRSACPTVENLAAFSPSFRVDIRTVARIGSTDVRKQNNNNNNN